MPLFEAIQNSNLSFIREYLRDGGGVNVRNTYGSTPLHEAVYEGEYAIVRLLLAEGADVGALDGYGNSPLHVACICGRKKIAMLLLAAGADIDQTSRGRTWTPLMLALNERYTELAEWMVAKGANVNHVDAEEGWTPLLVACEQGLTDISLSLIRQGSEVDAVVSGGDARGKSAIHLASYYGAIGMVRALLAAGVDVNTQPENGGLTALHWAVYNKYPEFLAFLLEAGAEVNIQAAGIYQLRAPLHFAVTADNEEMARLLLDYDANPLLKDEEGTTPLDIVLERLAETGKEKYQRLVKLLESYI